MEEKVILDTDIGSDIDDAICLSFLLSNPNCELLGVTTVTGEAEKRSMMVSYICEKVNKNIAVFPGLENPIIGEQKQKTCPQYEYLEKISYRKKYPEFEWLKFLREIIKENQGEINLIAIGPLTNIGILFKVCPEIPSLLKSLYIMGGVFFEKEKYAEWNISCDPYAAHIVFSSNVKEIYVCGLDVTKRVWMGKKKYMKNLKRMNCLKKFLILQKSGLGIEKLLLFMIHLQQAFYLIRKPVSLKKEL